MIIFDIGYNCGEFTNHMLKIYPNCKILAVDPDDTYGKNDSRITFINGAVSNLSNIDVTFYTRHICSPIGSIKPSWMEKIRHSDLIFSGNLYQKQVRSYTLDELIGVYGIPDIIKLDIEGSELDALLGLSKKCGTILFEWSEELYSEAIKCVDVLKKLGYTKFANNVCNEGDPQVMYLDDLVYGSWEEISSGYSIDEKNMNKWGMIYAK